MDGVSQLNYLNSVLLEVLRFSPAVAGLQRVSIDRDVLNNWVTPPRQVVGIALEPLHRDSRYFGEQPDQFHPERYLNSEGYLDNDESVYHYQDSSITHPQSKCPFKTLWPLHNKADYKIVNELNNPSVHEPLTFGDGARKCLGKHFAMYEMKVALAVLLYRFEFKVAPNFKAELELGKFGLFLSTFPKGGVEMMISPRPH